MAEKNAWVSKLSMRELRLVMHLLDDALRDRISFLDCITPRESWQPKPDADTRKVIRFTKALLMRYRELDAAVYAEFQKRRPPQK